MTGLIWFTKFFSLHITVLKKALLPYRFAKRFVINPFRPKNFAKMFKLMLWNVWINLLANNKISKF